VIGITSLVQGVYTASVEAEDITEGMERAIGDGICFGVSHVVIGNIKHTNRYLYMSCYPMTNSFLTHNVNPNK
jgi:hypothetical protein